MQDLASVVALDQLPAALQNYLLHPLLTILMCLLSVFVVLGNMLVVSAIWHENQLHSVTNYLIASLAAADCLVGALVMPFSIISEMIVGSWQFGPIWCDLWHSFDVLASTASIMNLCAISLDRYLAITNPISYPTKMTPKRVALLIVSLWTCSSLISFPAILWWQAVGQGSLQQVPPVSSSVSATILEDSRAASNATAALSPPVVVVVPSGSSSQSPPSPHMPTDHQQAVMQSLLELRRQTKDGTANDATTVGGNSMMARNVIPAATTTRLQQQPDETGVPYDGGGGGGGGNAMGNRLRPNYSIMDLSTDSTSPLQPAIEHAPEVRFKCVFTDDTYYLLFSSFVSFYGPLCVMLYAYICIYRAAVQQTRFLKHGSKQVMIEGGGGGGGGNSGCATNGNTTSGYTYGFGRGNSLKGKKNKRQRHPSEHSNQSSGTNRLANSSAAGDNHERQHLVLRAHRGGGAAAVAQSATPTKKSADSLGGSKRSARSASTATTTAPSSVGSSPNKHARGLHAPAHLRARHKGNSNELQASLTNDDDGDDEEEDESERPDQRPAVSSSLDRASTLSSSFNGETASPSGGDGAANNWSPQMDARKTVTRSSSANRSARVSLALSKRDRMRVESQRFEVSSSSSLVQEATSGHDEKSGATGQVTSATSVSSETIAGSPPAGCNAKTTTSAAASGGASNATHCDSLQRDKQQQNDTSLGSSAFKFVAAFRRSEPRAPPALPASLVPLIMMNSDTSTDSSIVTVVTRPALAEVTRKLSVESEGRNAESEPNHWKRRASGAGGGGGNSDTGGSTRSSAEALGALEVRCPNGQVTINLSLDGNGNELASAACDRQQKDCRGTSGGAISPPNSVAPSKGQILHYNNSDKLIQSIVDLTSIHYIDCAANNASVTKSAPAKTRGILCKTVSHGQGQAQSPSSERQLQVTVELSHQTSQNNRANHHQQQNNNNNGSVDRVSPPSSSLHLDSVSSTTANARVVTRTTSSATATPSTTTTSRQAACVAAETGSLMSATTTATAATVPRQQKSMGRKLTKLAKERKAAKTLGIVVGVFILCWLPFFVVNILVALCGIKCIYKPEILFSIVTWLGWLNSAMNPVIYACWSRDFRRAFRRVLCSWVEFLCYDGTRLARKLKLKKSSAYTGGSGVGGGGGGAGNFGNVHEIHSACRPASSTQRSGASMEANAVGVNNIITATTCGINKTAPADTVMMRSNNHSQRGLLSDPHQDQHHHQHR